MWAFVRENNPEYNFKKNLYNCKQYLQNLCSFVIIFIPLYVTQLATRKSLSDQISLQINFPVSKFLGRVDQNLNSPLTSMKITPLYS